LEVGVGYIKLLQEVCCVPNGQVSFWVRILLEGCCNMHIFINNQNFQGEKIYKKNILNSGITYYIVGSIPPILLFFIYLY
jgi:hypothetical protein